MFNFLYIQKTNFDLKTQNIDQFREVLALKIKILTFLPLKNQNFDFFTFKKTKILTNFDVKNQNFEFFYS